MKDVFKTIEFNGCIESMDFIQVTLEKACGLDTSYMEYDNEFKRLEFGVKVKNGILWITCELKKTMVFISYERKHKTSVVCDKLEYPLNVVDKVRLLIEMLEA